MDPRLEAGGVNYFDALSDLSVSQVRESLEHFRHWLHHEIGEDDARLLLGRLDAQHETVHELVDGSGWDVAVIVYVSGQFFDANVACGSWSLPPADRLRNSTEWQVVFEQHTARTSTRRPRT